MSELPKDGGSAFPIPHDDRPGAYVAEPGMSLRDYFAAHALCGMLASGREARQENWAEIAFLLADAMLEARSK